MQVNSIQNGYINKNNIPQFCGTVSPKYVQYVNELRQDCLEVVPKYKFKLINKVCDDILKKSTEVMEKCFNSDSVLSINTTKSQETDAIELSNILTKYFEGYAANVGYVAKKEWSSPIARLKYLRHSIKNGYPFGEACAQEIFQAKILVGQLIKCKDCTGNKEKFDDTINILKWWNEHINILKPEEKPGMHDLDRFKTTCNQVLSKLTQQVV